MLPGPAEQDELVQLIFRIKSGEVGEGVRHSMMRLAQALVDGGAAAIIAGCTEIPIVLGQSDVSVPLISSTGILAQRTIEFANEQ